MAKRSPRRTTSEPRERGATFVEYALIVGVFVLATFGSISWLTDSASDEFSADADSISDPWRYTPTTAVGTPPAVPAPSPSTTLKPTTTTTVKPTTTTTVKPTTTTTAAPTTTTTMPPTTTTRPPVAPVLGGNGCTGRSCTYSVSAPGSTVTWTASNGQSGSGTTISVEFSDEPGVFFGLFPSTSTYTIVVTSLPGPQTVEKTISCTGSAFSPTTCSD